MRNLAEAFDTLNRTNMPYVVLRDYEKLPHQHNNQVQVLCQDPEAIARVLGLSLTAGVVYTGKFTDGYDIAFALYKLGGDLVGLPHTFQSQLLHRRVLHEGLYIPDADIAFWMYAFERSSAGLIPNETESRVWRQKVEQVVGPLRQPREA